MSARTNAVNESLNRTGNTMDYTAAYTIMGWFYISVDLNADTTTLSINSGSLANFDLMGHGSDGTTIRLVSRTSSGAPSNTAGSATTAGVWQHHCLRRNSSTSIEAFLNGVSDTSNTQNAGSRGASSETWVSAQVGDFARFDGRAFGIREWSSALTTPEIVTEMNSAIVVKSGVSNDVPLSTDAIALTGTNFTEGGTITYEADPTFGGATNPKGPFTHPLFGPFKGPLS